MFKLFFIYLLLRCSSAISEPVFRNDHEYYEQVHGWMKLHTIPANWHDARLRCWTEGVPISDLPVSWITGQPDHVYTENCVVFHMNGTLEDVPCDDAFEFVCYKKFTALKMNSCKTVDNEYKLEGKTGHCYKLHPYGQTWSRAHMICTAEGGYLAIINNLTEVEVLKELFKKYPTQTIFSTYKDLAFVGIREWPDERSWYTVHGQNLNELGPSWWNAQPDNANLAGET